MQDENPTNFCSLISIKKTPLSRVCDFLYMSQSLLPLHHLIELDDISNFDHDIPLVVDTTIIARFYFVHIEWTHLQIRDLTASYFLISSDNTELRTVLNLSRCHAHTHDHHGVIFSRIEYCLHEGCSEF